MMPRRWVVVTLIFLGALGSPLVGALIWHHVLIVKEARQHCFRHQHVYVPIMGGHMAEDWTDGGLISETIILNSEGQFSFQTGDFSFRELWGVTFSARLSQISNPTSGEVLVEYADVSRGPTLLEMLGQPLGFFEESGLSSDCEDYVASARTRELYFAVDPSQSVPLQMMELAFPNG